MFCREKIKWKDCLIFYFRRDESNQYNKHLLKNLTVEFHGRQLSFFSLVTEILLRIIFLIISVFFYTNQFAWGTLENDNKIKSEQIQKQII